MPPAATPPVARRAAAARRSRPGRRAPMRATLRATADQLRKDGKLDEAAAAYQRAIDADRGNVDLYNDLGNVYFALKRYGDAAQAFRDATTRDPNYALGWYNLAHALRKGDKKPEAVDAYRQYMRLKPDDPDPYYGLGQTLKALGDVAGRDRRVPQVRGDGEAARRAALGRQGARGAARRSRRCRSRAPSPSGKIEEKDAADDRRAPARAAAARARSRSR